VHFCVKPAYVLKNFTERQRLCQQRSKQQRAITRPSAAMLGCLRPSRQICCKAVRIRHHRQPLLVLSATLLQRNRHRLASDTILWCCKMYACAEICWVILRTYAAHFRANAWAIASETEQCLANTRPSAPLSGNTWLNRGYVATRYPLC
jgi:hypothetical protein